MIESNIIFIPAGKFMTCWFFKEKNMNIFYNSPYTVMANTGQPLPHKRLGNAMGQGLNRDVNWVNVEWFDPEH